MMKNRFGANFGKHEMRIDYKTLTIVEDETLNNDDGDLGEMTDALDRLSL